MFDWQRFLRQHNVHYVTSGPNTGRGRLSVKCPFCREADPSEHMGISLRGTHWGCLRNSRHRGNSRSYLIQALLRCSFEEAQRLAGEEGSPPPMDEDLLAIVTANLNGQLVETKPATLQLLPEFKPLTNKSVFATPFHDYMLDPLPKGRDYTKEEMAWLTKNYNLLYTTQGDFKYRIIIPICDANSRLRSWTGRTVISDKVRYKTLSLQRREGYTGPLALDASSNLLLGLPMLWRVHNASVLVVCEGPFDALRITTFGHQFGVYGTCLFGLNVSLAQADLLEDLAGWFDRLILLIDPEEAELHQIRLLDQLSRVPITTRGLPKGVKDPGELSAAQATALIQSWLT